MTIIFVPVFQQTWMFALRCLFLCMFGCFIACLYSVFSPTVCLLEYWFLKLNVAAYKKCYFGSFWAIRWLGELHGRAEICWAWICWAPQRYFLEYGGYVETIRKMNLVAVILAFLLVKNFRLRSRFKILC